ncbi:acyl-CoA dehydrogenase family protein [Streptomyces fuscichromogenes]|uniref:Acyl-CoA dehydrogenase n=1 Tax=Streptomyces fuscichromogenes TaxID=1324013 RepID=A0A918CNT5_9ACTN|nr:acyl-CoA dehydrogenase family protein [Streptomyces fuscichromogenes]GGM98025.1 acyl-CoA dehydrogenase [Streptomyces fuscichromogenes]
MTAKTGPYDGPGGLGRFQTELTAWLDENDAFFPRRAAGMSLAGEVARSRANQHRLWQAGWLRHGWPESVGGMGGSRLFRAAVTEEAARRGLYYDTLAAVGEVLGPTVIEAAPDLARRYITPFLDGTEGWCQGFSEPEAGSDLASLRCRAVDAGDHWVVDGQKLWTSYAQFASRMVLLARTGTTEDRHRGITALLVDMGSPGMTVRPLHGINDMAEFSETFFDSVRVPKDRVIGEVNGGWSVAMRMLRSERGGIFWMLSAWLLEELERLAGTAGLTAADDEAVGRLFATVAALRARSWTTQHRLAADGIETPETSIDKILMATAEQELFDLVRTSLDGVLEFADTDEAVWLRSSYMYSRAASVYGGTAEIQRNIVADQLLGLRGA